MAKTIDELKTIAEVVYEVVESSDLSSEDMAFVMQQVCSAIRPDWAMMPFQMIAGSMQASGAEKCTIKFNKKGRVECSFHAPKGGSLDLKHDEEGGEA